jgi:cyclopropane-fatty-acyl-phospholipid synthase
MQLAIDLAERRRLPDALVRMGIRRFVGERLREERRGAVAARTAARLESLRASAIALATDEANAQHYEVPTEFFRIVLGRHLKYSAGLWDATTASLDDAEARMLELYAARAGLADGQRILDLGCGWGSFTLWAAQRYPRARITAVSNSASQRCFIEATACTRGLNNVQVITADVNTLDLPSASFDRAISVEMFEHVRNYEALLGRIARWLADDGKLFVHIFCHRELLYPFESDGAGNWMGRHFFTDGLMPAATTLAHFDRDLRVEQAWALSGTHYARTARAWLQRMDAAPGAVRDVLQAVYGTDVDRWVQRWRMFFMACEELFGYRGGREWQLGHYLMSRTPAPRG